MRILLLTRPHRNPTHRSWGATRWPGPRSGPPARPHPWEVLSRRRRHARGPSPSCVLPPSRPCTQHRHHQERGEPDECHERHHDEHPAGHPAGRQIVDIISVERAVRCRPSCHPCAADRRRRPCRWDDLDHQAQRDHHGETDRAGPTPASATAPTRSLVRAHTHPPGGPMRAIDPRVRRSPRPFSSHPSSRSEAARPIGGPPRRRGTRRPRSLPDATRRQGPPQGVQRGPVLILGGGTCRRVVPARRSSCPVDGSVAIASIQTPPAR